MKKYVQEINGELRIQELTMAIKTNLEILSMKLGLGEDYWRLDSNYFAYTKKTATEVVASNSDLIRTIHKYEISILLFSYRDFLFLCTFSIVAFLITFLYDF